MVIGHDSRAQFHRDIDYLLVHLLATSGGAAGRCIPPIPVKTSLPGFGEALEKAINGERKDMLKRLKVTDVIEVRLFEDLDKCVRVKGSDSVVTVCIVKPGKERRVERCIDLRHNDRTFPQVLVCCW